MSPQTGVFAPPRAVRRGARRVRAGRRRVLPVARRRAACRDGARAHGEILGVAGVERGWRDQRLARSPGAARPHDASRARGRRAGTGRDVDVVYASANATRGLDARRSGRADRAVRRRQDGRDVDQGRARRIRRVRRRRLRRGVALRRRGTRAADRRLGVRRSGRGVAAAGARPRSTRRARSCSSTASRAAARCSASCSRVDVVSRASVRVLRLSTSSSPRPACRCHDSAPVIRTRPG